MKYKALIQQMTLDEKVSLMSGKDFWQTMNIDRLDIPSIFLADGPNGLRKQKAAADHLGLNESVKATCFPTSATIANAWNETLTELIGSTLGKEAVSEKVSVILGPGVNIKRNPLAGRNFEYYSEDPYLAGKMGAAFVRGVQKEGIATTVKHFAANNQEYRRMSIDSVVDERALREIYLTPFEMTVKEGKSRAIMASYNLVNGTYANENEHLLKDILRTEWGFDGVIVSDWGGINDRVASLKATSELEMPTSGGQTNQEILEAVKNGTLDVSILDEAVDRLLTMVFQTHRSLTNVSPFDVEAHHKVAEYAAQESIVMLKNDHVLPIEASKKVAVIGDFADQIRFQGAGSSGVNPTKVDSLLDQLKTSNIDVIGYEKGYHRYGKKNEKLLNKAVKLANQSDIILLAVGLDEYSETEGLDRTSIQLPSNQVKLIERLSLTNKPIVALLFSGSVVDLSWDSKVAALLHASLPGQAGANAIIKILEGKVSPSGKLSETYPLRYEDTPSAAYFPGLENTVEYRESIFVGYRYFDSKGLKVKYPFGYGLSYTKFAFSNIDVTEQGVSFRLKNIGKMTGKEVVQLYVGKHTSKLLRPKKELKGFKKIELEPGQSEAVFIPFDAYTFRFFNTKSNQFEVESGLYWIYVGSSSLDIALESNITIEGNETELQQAKQTLPNYEQLTLNQVTDQEFETLLERALPKSTFQFYKKNRMKVDYNTTVQQLRYSKGWTGRFFAWGVRFGYQFMKLIGNRKTANMMQMALYQNPMRNISRLTGGAVSWQRLDGMIMMFNGHFYRGLKQVLFTKKNKNKKVEN